MCTHFLSSPPTRNPRHVVHKLYSTIYSHSGGKPWAIAIYSHYQVSARVHSKHVGVSYRCTMHGGVTKHVGVSYRCTMHGGVTKHVGVSYRCTMHGGVTKYQVTCTCIPRRLWESNSTRTGSCKDNSSLTSIKVRSYKSSLVPRLTPAFRHLQYRKTGYCTQRNAGVSLEAREY